MKKTKQSKTKQNKTKQNKIKIIICNIDRKILNYHKIEYLDNTLHH
jgi:hypothetical protein